MILGFVHWDVDPVLFAAGGFTLRYYSLFFAAGVTLGYTALRHIFRQEGISLIRLDRLSVYVFVGILAGARLGHCLFYEPGYYLSHPWEIILPWQGTLGRKDFHYTGFQGLASHGGAWGIVLAVFLFSRKYRMNFLSVMDKLAPVVPLTGFFIRIGNLFNSEIIGRPAALPFAFVFDRVDGLPRHPAQLYEAGAYLLIFVFLFFVLRKRAAFHPAGSLLGWLLILLFTARFILEFFKEDQVAFEGRLILNMGQVLSIPFVLVGLFLVILNMIQTTKRILPFILLGAGCAISGCHGQRHLSASTPGIEKVGHVVVIYMENHSFDNLYGQFEGADGVPSAPSARVIQVDSQGRPYQYLPPIAGSSAFPTNLPNAAFNIDQYIPSDAKTPDALHRWYQEQLQIDGGKMDKYALYNFSKGLSMGYYNTNLLPLNAYARKYTLCDHFFHSVFGGSFLNHQWLIAAATPVYKDAPASMRSKTDADGHMISDGTVTPDGYVVNTSYSVNAPRPANVPVANLIPNQTNPTIGDRLSDKGISWAWYGGGWDSAMAGTPDAEFPYHHQPFMYYTRYADGTAAKKEHLLDEKEFVAAAKAGHLPAVSFVKPGGREDEHPGSTDVFHSESHAVDLINAVLDGPDGKDAVIILTYDENGGFWDHVPPPVIDKWGPGTRIPAIVISPFAKKGFVDHTQYETVSILAFIEKRWGLQPLNDRDGKAHPLENAFDFSQKP